jgi:hypothetical protein
VNERGKRNGEFVCTERPPESRISLSAQVRLEKGKEEVLLFGLRDQEVAEYHYRFYQALSALLGERASVEARAKYATLLREELASQVHGEVDEESWRLKQMVLRRQTNIRKETKLFRDYARQSFIDTLTLYLHGICCDIDVDTGPRQLPSRLLRARLNLLASLFPPPDGFAVFPEQLQHS